MPKAIPFLLLTQHPGSLFGRNGNTVQCNDIRIFLPRFLASALLCHRARCPPSASVIAFPTGHAENLLRGPHAHCRTQRPNPKLCTRRSPVVFARPMLFVCHSARRQYRARTRSAYFRHPIARA
eukprot:235333-Rhodomonas_salina.1